MWTLILNSSEYPLGQIYNRIETETNIRKLHKICTISSTFVSNPGLWNASHVPAIPGTRLRSLSPHFSLSLRSFFAVHPPPLWGEGGRQTIDYIETQPPLHWSQSQRLRPSVFKSDILFKHGNSFIFCVNQCQEFTWKIGYGRSSKFLFDWVIRTCSSLCGQIQIYMQSVESGERN